MSADSSPHDLSRWTPEHLACEDPNSHGCLDRWNELVSDLQAWLASRPSGFGGLEAAISRLNEVGHALAAAESRSEGWVIYRGPLRDPDHYLQVSATRDPEPEIMITTPLTDAAWARELEARRADLSPQERAADERRDHFYERGGQLSVDHYDSWTTLPHTERVWMATSLVVSEVNNGGFAQYFDNTTGRQAEFAADAFRTIGALETEKLLRRAIELIGAPFGDDLTERQWDALERAADQLNGLDDAFYEVDEDIAGLVMDWIDRQ